MKKLLFLLMFALILVLPIVIANPFRNNPMVYYDFRRTGVVGQIDESGNNNNANFTWSEGSIVKNSCTQVNGILNTAINSTSSNNCVMGSERNMSFPSATTPRTISWWGNFYGTSQQIVFALGNALENCDTPNPNGCFGVIFQPDSNLIGIAKNNFNVGLGLDSSTDCLLNFDLPDSFFLSKFQFYSIVFTGSLTQLYVNGTLFNSSVSSQCSSYPVAGASDFGIDAVHRGLRMRMFGELGLSGVAYGGESRVVLDEVGVWNRSLSASEILQLYNDKVGLNPFDAITNTTISSPINGTENATFINNNITYALIGNLQPLSLSNVSNFTINLWKDGVLYNQTFISNNSNQTVIVNYSRLITDAGNYLWNIQGCTANVLLSNCSFAQNNFTFRIFFLEKEQNFRPTTTTGSTENFNISTSLSQSNINSYVVNLIYNNTVYSSSVTSAGNNLTFSSSSFVPFHTGNSVFPFYWNFNITFNNGTRYIFNSSNYTQTSLSFAIDNCTNNTMKILNFTLLDEDSLTNYVNGTVEVLVNIFDLQRIITYATFNQSFILSSLKNAVVCVSNSTNQFSLDYQVRYFGNSTYVSEYKFLQNFTLTNTTGTQNVSLFDLLDSRSTAFKITLTNPDISVIEGALIDVDRQYIPLNQFISVETPKTDVLGQAIVHLVTEEPYYNFVVTKNGKLLGTFNFNQVQCQNVITGDCRIELNLVNSFPSIIDFRTYGNITGTFTWSPTTRTLFFSFVSTNSQQHLVGWNVTKLDNWGNTTLCKNQITALASSFTCVIPTIYGNSSIVADVYVDGILWGRSNFDFLSPARDTFGGTGVILALVMYGILALLFIGNPITTVIGSTIGMIASVTFHFIDGGTFIGNSAIIVWFIIAAGIIIYTLVRSKE